MSRYEAQIVVTVQFDATSPEDADEVVVRLGDRLTLSTSGIGRDVEIAQIEEKDAREISP